MKKTSNEFLKLKGLKSLEDIKKEYGEKKRHIFSKTIKKKKKVVKKEKTELGFLEKKELYDIQKEILDELKSISSFLRREEKKEKRKTKSWLFKKGIRKRKKERKVQKFV